MNEKIISAYGAKKQALKIKEKKDAEIGKRFWLKNVQPIIEVAIANGSFQCLVNVSNLEFDQLVIEKFGMSQGYAVSRPSKNELLVSFIEADNYEYDYLEGNRG